MAGLKTWAVGATAMGAALAAMAGSASAQQTVSGVEVVTTRQAGLNLSETAATGSRLNLSVLEIPASVERLTGDQIRARGDLSLADAIARTTGMVQQNNPGNGSTASFAARGFSGVGSVMTLYDGMRLFVGAGTVTFPFDPWTVEQVEVLRGPASVMFGQGAIGGAVNVTPKRPSLTESSVDAQAAIGSNSTYRLGVGAGGPVAQGLAYRLDVSRQSSDGYVDRGQSDSWALSGSLRWAPSDTLSFLLSHDYGDQEPARYFGTPLINGGIDGRTTKLNYNVEDARMRFKDNMTQLRAEWTPAEGVKVRNALYRLSSDREWRNAETYLYDPATRTVDRTDYIPILHDQTQYGDLFDVSFDHDLGGMENALVVGAEYNTVRFVHTNDGFPGTTTTVDAFAPALGRYIETAPFIPRYRTRTRQVGLFAEDRLKLSQTLSLVGGVRFDHYHVRRLNLVSGVQQVDRKLENVGYRLGLVYAPRKDVSFYAQYTTGSDPLGSLITTSAGQAPFELSTGRQVEVGAKGLFLDGRGEWTVAAFRIVKDKLLTRDLLNPAQQIQVGQRSSKGVEASLAVQLGGGWSVEANGTILDAQYDDFLEPTAGGLVDRKGMTPFDTPERSANLWLSWAFAEGWRVYGGARYVGRQFGDNAESVVLPSYTVADAGVEWRPRPNYAVNLQVFNAFDERYATSGYGPGQWILARPRAVELRLSGRF